jgi:hypothetical protein
MIARLVTHFYQLKIRFTNFCKLFVNGSLRAVLDHNNKIEMLDLSVSSYNEYIPRSQLQPQEPVEQKQSPRVSKNMNKRAQQKQPTHPHIILPESLVNGHGIPPGVQSFLEVHFPENTIAVKFALTVGISRLRRRCLT